MRRFKVVKRRYSEPRTLTSEGITTFRRSKMQGANLIESTMEEPDMTQVHLNEAKVYNAEWQAPNLTKAGLAGLIGYRSLKLLPVINTAPYQKHPLLAMAQALTNSDVNATWDKWFKQPLQRKDVKAQKAHQTIRTVMKEADVSGLNFKDKNLKHFDLTNAKALKTDFSQALIGRVPMEKYVKSVLETNNSAKKKQLIDGLKTYLPKLSYKNNHFPILSENNENQQKIEKLVKKSTRRFLP